MNKARAVFAERSARRGPTRLLATAWDRVIATDAVSVDFDFGERMRRVASDPSQGGPRIVHSR